MNCLLQLRLHRIRLLAFFTLLYCFEISAPSPTARNADAVTDRISSSNRLPPASEGGLSGSWEDARQIWNGLRTMKKEYSGRNRRQVESDPTPQTARLIEDNDLNNLSIPAYMKELYWNISKQGPDDIDTTTIRSLPGLHTGFGCGFNFSMGELSNHEVFTRAELRIHMQQPDGSNYHPVVLRLHHGRHKGTFKKLSPSREGWIVFDVLSHVNRWRAANHSHKNIHFYIVTYPSLDDMTKDVNGKDCRSSSIKFDQALAEDRNTSEIDKDFQPLLMIYSHNLDDIMLNVSALIEAADSKQRRDVSSTTSYSGVSDATPTPDPMGSCRKHNYEIDRDTFNTIWHLGQSSQDVLVPTTFNIGVCGGDCDRDVPRSLAQHSIILYYLHLRDHQTPYRNIAWGQCCAPVKYRSVETLFSLPNNGEFRIVTLRDLSVERCSCLTIFRRPPPTDSDDSSR